MITWNWVRFIEFIKPYCSFAYLIPMNRHIDRRVIIKKFHFWFWECSWSFQRKQCFQKVFSYPFGWKLFSPPKSASIEIWPLQNEISSVSFSQSFDYFQRVLDYHSRIRMRLIRDEKLLSGENFWSSRGGFVRFQIWQSPFS